MTWINLNYIDELLVNKVLSDDEILNFALGNADFVETNDYDKDTV